VIDAKKVISTGEISPDGAKERRAPTEITDLDHQHFFCDVTYGRLGGSLGRWSATLPELGDRWPKRKLFAVFVVPVLFKIFCVQRALNNYQGSTKRHTK
jgi:hypothetical protein